MRPTLRWIILPLLGAAAYAQSARAQASSGYRVVTYTTRDGLPSQTISSLAQTPDGYLWLAAGGMLARFDGYEFREYRGVADAELVRRVVSVHAGLGDTLWVLDEGSAVFAMVNGRTVPVVPASNLGLGLIAQDSSGALLGLVPSVWRLRRDGGVAEEVSPHLMLPKRYHTPVSRDRRGQVWVVDSLLSLYDVDIGGRSIARRGAVLGAITSRATREIFTIRARGSLRDVVNEHGEIVATYRDSPDARAALVDRDGRTWVTTPRGAEIYEPGSIEPVERIPELKVGPLGAIIEGDNGCVWASDIALRKACRVPFRTIPPPLHNIALLARGPSGSVLTWDSAGRVVCRDPRGGAVLLDPPRREMGIALVHLDRRGTQWWSDSYLPMIGRRADGRGPLLLLPQRYVYRVADNRRDPNVLWYASGTYLYRAEPYGPGGARVTDSLAMNGRVTAMSVARDSALWATVKLSDLSPQLVRVARGKVTTFSGVKGFPRGALRAVLADDDGTIWLGTYGSGLVRFRNGRFDTVTQSDGLAENVVTSLLDDDAGNLWMGGNLSVHRVARRDIEDFLSGFTRRVGGVAYGEADGLLTPETSGFSGVRDDAGRLWFPTLAGAAVVNPAEAVSLDRTPPRVHVLGLRTDRDTLEASDSVVQLARGSRRLDIAYTAIAFRNSAAVRYQYRIDGVDADWIDAGTARVATYNNVGPGRHTFRVRAVNAGGISSVNDLTLQFIVPPFFHETPIFSALLLVATGALAWFALRFREARARRREFLLTEAVGERTAKLTLALDTVARQADQLRTLDEAKSRFFANVSHEFRTPLSLIIGPVDDLREGRAGELAPVVRRRLDGVQQHARRLLQLVEQLLDVARLESGTMRLTADVRDLVPLIRRMAESFASLAERRGIDFRLSCPVGGIRVRYDLDQMEKVVSNLVGNALKFTPSGGRVELRMKAESAGDAGGTAVIEIEDTGPGIAPEHQAKVFERFYQVDDSSRRAHEGTGIGLALVRELVELHDGIIELHSVVGAGSTFTVRLPLAAGGGRGSGEHVATAVPTAPASTPAIDRPPEGRRIVTSDDVITVLLVEDNADLLEFLREHLAGRFRVLAAANGSRGLEMAREHVPDLIISDVMMPEMDGQSLCEAVKGDAEIDFVPVILLTAKASRESRLAGLIGGADDYLTKPVDLAELLIRADNLIASRRRVRERLLADDRRLPSISVPVKGAPRDASGRATLERLSEVLSTHLADDDFGAEDLAAAMGMSRSTLYRRLEPLLGLSPMDALWEYRLQQAAQWLGETSITVSEVAYGVGFKSVPHFCGKFRERFGATPSGYRRAHARGEALK